LCGTSTRRTDRRPVTWEVVGYDGATATRIRYRLLPQLGENLDVAVLLAGVNDVLGRRTPAQWREDLAAIVDDLDGRAKHVLVSGLPPFRSFPSLPTTLGRHLGERADALDAVSQEVCAEHSRATWMSATDIMPMGPDFFARDGFHPSPVGYGLWAKAAADQIAI
jgi:lysophospholipase L1-like esterase